MGWNRDDASGVLRKLTTDRVDFTFAYLPTVSIDPGAAVLGILFVAAGVFHFVKPEIYLRVMPRWLPAHRTLVALSGVTEIAAGALLLYGPTRALGAWLIVAQLVAFFAVHVDMLAHSEGTGRGLPRWALWVRLALQFGLIGWAWAYTG